MNALMLLQELGVGRVRSELLQVSSPRDPLLWCRRALLTALLLCLVPLDAAASEGASDPAVRNLA